MQVVYLVRHGAAKSSQEDPQRGLTTAGRETVQQMAGWGARAGIEVDQIDHSGKLRAEQTATIFAAALRPDLQPQAMPGLAPNDEVRPIADWLNVEPATRMLVGHLPFLSRLVSQLVLGEPDRQLVLFEPAAVVWLVKADNGWVIQCVRQPSWR
ncbi:MAG: phosphohistidine phosphatase SixA [Planctomycetales bacterium]|nr:phosphohistidine phosphatase SixA [Planctomycetales bacterium]